MTATIGKCKVCTKHFDVSGYAESHQKRLISSGVCPTDDHWAGMWLDRNSSRVVRINGEHYRLSQAGDMFTMSGDFHIRFHDGREVRVTGLSHQGTIPDEWAGVLQDNASFVQKIEVQYA